MRIDGYVPTFYKEVMGYKKEELLHVNDSSTEPDVFLSKQL